LELFAKRLSEARRVGYPSLCIWNQGLEGEGGWVSWRQLVPPAPLRLLEAHRQMFDHIVWRVSILRNHLWIANSRQANDSMSILPSPPARRRRFQVGHAGHGRGHPGARFYRLRHQDPRRHAHPHVPGQGQLSGGSWLDDRLSDRAGLVSQWVGGVYFLGRAGGASGAAEPPQQHGGAQPRPAPRQLWVPPRVVGPQGHQHQTSSCACSACLKILTRSCQGGSPGQRLSRAPVPACVPHVRAWLWPALGALSAPLAAASFSNFWFGSVYLSRRGGCPLH